jgi:hypothetical protein
VFIAKGGRRRKGERWRERERERERERDLERVVCDKHLRVLLVCSQC